MFKPIQKAISIIFITAIVNISCCSSSNSDAMRSREPGYIPPPAVQQAPKILIIQKAEASSEEVTNSVEMEEDLRKAEAVAPALTPNNAQQAQEQQKPLKKTGRDLPSVIIDVLVALGKTIALLSGLAGAYLLYQKFAHKKSLPVAEKIDKDKPGTIEEAVSSYIKHKLKK